MTASLAPSPTAPTAPTVTVHEADRGQAFDTMMNRLNRLSVTKRHDAYLDIDWDDPSMELWQDDLLELNPLDPLGRTDWYQALSPGDKATFGALRAAQSMKIGLEFENLLQQGLLRLALSEPNGSTAFRYMHHEIIEESQHTMMFQEFVNRSGLPVAGASGFWARFGPKLALASINLEPALFFLFVLGGEEPVDHLQRKWLQHGVRHPLVERIMRIHVTEEARHISFARHYLTTEVPKMSRVKRFILATQAPIVMGVMVRMMMLPSKEARRYIGLPDEVVDEAFASPEGRRLLAESAAKVERLWEELGLTNALSRHLWRRFGVHTEPEGKNR